jgi:hypothetical protein
MIVWGGRGTADFNYGGRYSPSTNTWAAIPTDVNIPYPRSEHTAVWTGTLMIVWGGYGGGYLNTGGRYCAPCELRRSGYRDLDGDGYGDPNATVTSSCDGVLPAGSVENAADCDDTSAAVHPGAPEVNDGLDNQCPGDSGFGAVDEVGICGFFDPLDRNRLCWPAQSGATGYDVVRSSSPAFSGTCAGVTTTDACWSPPGDPSPGGIYYFLVRAAGPNIGSWGQDSHGVERANICQ